MPQIVTLTLNPAVDKISSVPQVVAERKLRCEPPRFDPGGGGLNVARAIQILGGQVTAYWTCGGPMGRLLAERLVLSGRLPPGAPDDFYARAARESPAHCRVILDTSGPPLRQGIEGAVYLIKPNVRELSELAGNELLEDAEICELGQQCENIRAPTVKVRSKVGAGDSTVAGIVLGLAQETDILDAVRLGVAAGSAAVMAEGTELCRQEDAWRLYEEMSRNTERG